MKSHESKNKTEGCGIPVRPYQGALEVISEDLKKYQVKLQLIDVRGPDEFHGELGHIEGSKLITLGPDLSEFLKKSDKSIETVFVCRSGARSLRATQEAMELGYLKCYNLNGGMIRWNDLKYPVEK